MQETFVELILKGRWFKAAARVSAPRDRVFAEDSYVPAPINLEFMVLPSAEDVRGPSKKRSGIDLTPGFG